MRLEERVFTYPEKCPQSEGSTFINDRRAGLTVDVQLVHFGLDRHFLLLLSWDELAFDGPDQARVDGIEFDAKVRRVHLPGFAVRLIVYVLLSVAKRGGLTCRGELIQFLRVCGCEVDESEEGEFTPSAHREIWRCLLWVASPVVKVETFRRWRDCSAAERRAVEEEGLAQSSQLGVSRHGSVEGIALERLDHIYTLVSACTDLLTGKMTNQSVHEVATSHN